MNTLRRVIPLIVLAGCQPRTPQAPSAPAATASSGPTLMVRDTVIRSPLEASGIAAAIREATLATTLMGSVTEVLVHEGQRVRGGEVLARIDARDVEARGVQAAAGVLQAEAAYENARTRALRLRALYADSAAPKAQLDDAEAALARSDAGVRAARGAVAEVATARSYADIRAPFDGIITKRYVDPGTFVAMGAPLVAIADASRLRLSVTVTPADVHGFAAGGRIDARVEGQPADATVEGFVPAAGSALYIVNLLIDNRSGRFLAGASGTALLPQPPHTGILLPQMALVREGELTGVRVRNANGTSELRWLQVGRADAGHVEVFAGLRTGEKVELPSAPQLER